MQEQASWQTGNTACICNTFRRIFVNTTDKETTPDCKHFEFLAQEIHRIKYMAHNYAGKKLNLLDRFSQFMALRTLKRLSKTDAGSSEVLCFDYCVLAAKKA
jgi:hypothetical protein